MLHLFIDCIDWKRKDIFAYMQGMVKSATNWNGNGSGLNGLLPDPLLLGAGMIVTSLVWRGFGFISHTCPALTYIHNKK